MIRFVGQRLLQIAVVAIAIVFFVHLGMRMAGNSSGFRRDLRLLDNSRVAWSDTKDYLGDVVAGDLGQIESRRGPLPVSGILADTYGKSMGLLLAALALSLVVAVPLGVFAALARRAPWVAALLTLTVLGVSTPSFFAALLLQVETINIQNRFGVQLAQVGGFGWDKHMILPTLVLAARPIAYLTRAIFVQLERVMAEDYIRTAFAKGLHLRWVVNEHALRNVAVPVLTAAGVSLRFSLSSLPVVEFFFGWPGMGDRLIDAIRGGQTPVVVTLALALGLTFLFVNLLLDVSYRLIDPRLRSLDL